MLPELAKVDGIARVRVSYLQPAEVRPGLIEVMTSTPGVVPYFDLSFQHASGPVLRRMRRFGDRERFTELVERIRQARPGRGRPVQLHRRLPRRDGRRTSRELELFLSEARLDAIGIFGYSDEDGTEAATFADEIKLDEDEIARRVERVRRPRRGGHGPAGRRPGRRDGRGAGRGGTAATAAYEGRAAHQAPDVDGSTTLLADRPLAPGDLVTARVVESDGRRPGRPA